MSQDEGVQGSGSADYGANQRYETLANAVADGLFQVDADDRLVAVNDAFLALSNADHESLLDEPISRALPSPVADRLSTARQNLAESESDDVTISASFPTDDGESCRCEIRLRCVDEVNGDVAGSIRPVDDPIGSAESTGSTETVGADDPLDEPFGSTLPAGLPGVVYRCENEPGWPMTAVSEGATSLSGYEPADLTRDEVNWTEDVIDERDRETVRNERQSVRDGIDEFELEYRIRTADGETKWVAERGHAICDESGEVAVLEGFITDVTERREHEQALRHERDLVTQILEASPGGITLVDGDNAILRANERAAEVAGRTVEELLELDSAEIQLYDEDCEPIPAEEHPSIRALEAEETVVGGEYRIERPDGEWRWLAIRATPIDTDEDGAGANVVLSIQDVTALKRQQGDLRRERDLVERILETSPIGIAVLSAEETVEHVNERGQEILGIDTATPDPTDEQAAVLDEHGDPVPPEDRPSIRAFSKGEYVTDWECQYDHPEHGRRWLSVNATPVYDEDGAVERVVTAGDDVTRLKAQAKQLERQRDELEHELGEIFERIDDAFFALDDEWRFTYVNDRARELIDGPESGLLGTGIWEVVPEVVGSEFHREIERSLADQEPVSFEGYYEPIAAWFEVSAYPSETGLSVYFRDVTERKERERELEEYETIVKTVDDGVYVLDEDFGFEMVNDAYVEMTGYDREQLLGADPSLVIDQEVSDESADLLAEIAAGETDSASIEADIHRADGTHLRAESKFTAIPSDDAEGPRKVGVVRDVTERKERERELEQYHAVTQAASDAIVIIDEASTIVSVNPAVADVLGYDPADLEGEPIMALMSSEMAEDHRFAVGRYLETGEETFNWDNVELPGRHRDGHEVPLAVSINEFEHDGDRYFAGVLRDVTGRVERERELEESRNRYQALVENFPNGAVALVDDDLRYSTVGGTPIAEAETTVAELEGSLLEDVLPPDVADVLVPRYVDALDGEPSAFEQEMDGHVYMFWTIPVRNDSGDVFAALGMSQDISERKEREQELERYETIVETVNDGIYVVDEAGRFTMVNDEYARMVDYDRDELVGADVSLVVDDSTAGQAQVVQEQMVGGERDSATLEADLLTADGERVPAEATFALLEAGDRLERIAVVRDITERRARERALEESERRYRTLAENFPNGSVAMFDDELRYTAVGGQLLAELGLEPEDVIGDVITDRYPDDLVERVEPYFRAALDGEATTFEAELYDRDLYAHTLPVKRADGEVYAGMLVVQDVTELRERERELERYETIVETVDDGVYALDPDGNFVLVNDAFCEISGYDREELLGKPGKTVTNERINETAARLAAEVDANEREAAVLELDLQTADGGSVPVETRFGPYPYDDERYGRTGVTRDITQRLERERALERHREELAALNRLNEVVGELIHTLVESSSRAEIERLVCERLADSDSYSFAWIGEVDRANDVVALRTEAGVTGYLDDVTLTVDPEAGDDGPTARAVRTREPQVVQDTATDEDYEPWRDLAESHAFRSSAAIPIVYEDVLYGVLNVYSERVGAFDGYEQTLLERLGNVVGHTINALERKEALMSDQVQEIDLEMPDVTAYLDEPVSTDGTITFERTVPVGEQTYLQYGSADEEVVALLEALVEAIPFWEEVAILDDRFGEARFELRLSEPPAISTMAAYGGRVRSATIEDGHFRMCAELPPAADVRTVIEALDAEYPGVELVAQRRRARDAWSVRRIDDLLEKQLTDRQRTSLETAYYAGYFDTPRKRSGEAVAESLGITAPTLHQHLRKGQRKLLTAVFVDEEDR